MYLNNFIASASPFLCFSDLGFFQIAAKLLKKYLCSTAAIAAIAANSLFPALLCVLRVLCGSNQKAAGFPPPLL
jgi:hypothetical protein